MTKTTVCECLATGLATMLLMERFLDRGAEGQGYRPVGLFIEHFAGIGALTRLLRDRFPDAENDVWAQTPEEADFLKKIRRRITIHEGDLADATSYPAGAGHFLDFPTWTLKHAQGLYQVRMQRLFESKPRFVCLSDSAVSKLYLNAKVYGLKTPDLAGYRSAVDDWAKPYGYGITDAETADASKTLLWFEPL